MAALPYMQLYIADYLADTPHLSADEHGAYLLLMMNYWHTGKPIPKARLQSIARIQCNERWTDVERTLNEYFFDDGTHWQHKRIDADLDSVAQAQEQRSKAGKASAEARKAAQLKRNKERKQQVSNSNPTTVERAFNGRSTNKDGDGDGDGEENKKILRDSDESRESREFYETAKGRKLKGKALESFERFWLAFDYKRDKARAADSWYQRWPMIEPQIEQVIIAAQIEGQGRPSLKASGTTPKMAEGWISGRRWENENLVGDHVGVIEIYNEILANHPKADFETWKQSEGYQHLQDLWSQSERNRDLGFWRAFFNVAANDAFCAGDNKSGKPVSLGWLVIPKNFTRLVESA